jgi:hypothetical protein
LGPLVEFCGPISFDIDKMVLRESTNGSWTKVDEYSEQPYFGGTYLKPHPRKKDGTVIFTPPTSAKMPVFGLVFEKGVWRQIEALQEAKVCTLFIFFDRKADKVLCFQMYAGQSQSPEPTAHSIGPTAELLDGVGLRSKCTKRKAPVSRNGKGPRRKNARKEWTNVSDSNPDDDNGKVTNSSEEGGSESGGLEDGEDGSEGNKDIGDAIQGDGTEIGGHEDSEIGEGVEDVEDEAAKACAARFTHDIKSLQRDFMEALATSQPDTINPTAIATPAAAAPPKPYVQLDIETLRRGFLAGGDNSQNRNMGARRCWTYTICTYIDQRIKDSYISEPIHFIPLPKPSFSELINEPTKLREELLGSKANLYLAFLRYNPKGEYLGVGSFKTTTAAHLTFRGTNFPLSGLVRLAQQTTDENGLNTSVSVALKRPYRTNNSEKEVPVLERSKIRMAFAEEQVTIFEECKLMVWANSLLRAAYDFMDDFIDKNSPPPFDMLKFRFVEAGMAIALKPLDQAGHVSAAATGRAAYLLEEVLPGDKTDFVKYLHNASAVPRLSRDDPDYKLAEFLTFVQHVQYRITGELAYVSDFQGKHSFESFTRYTLFSKLTCCSLGVGLHLTDPQILTAPYVIVVMVHLLLLMHNLHSVLGNNLFGDGNVGEAFNLFPTQHECNEYCEWFKLGRLSDVPKKQATQKRRSARNKEKNAMVAALPAPTT